MTMKQRPVNVRLGWRYEGYFPPLKTALLLLRFCGGSVYGQATQQPLTDTIEGRQLAVSG